MNTGVQCKADPDCPVPAPAETRICHCHEKSAALMVLRQLLSKSTDRELEAG